MTGKDILLEEVLLVAEKNKYSGIFILPTGAGKGKLMIEIANRLKPKDILYLSNRVLLRDKMFIDELHKWDSAYLLDIMDRECYQAFCRKSDKHYSLVLGDEFDAALTDEYIKCFTQNTFDNKILVSATLDAKKRRLAAKIAPIIFERTASQLTQNKVLNSVKYVFIRYNLSNTENLSYLNFNRQFRELLNKARTPVIEFRLKQLQLARKHYMSNLATSVEVCKWLLKRVQGKTLVFCGLSKQADLVCKNSFHSANEDIQAFRDFDAGKITQIAVVDKVDRGVNIDGVRNIIHESVTGSKSKATQRIGRGMRLDINDTLVVYFLVPYYRNFMGESVPTIVQSWITSSCEDMDMSDTQQINYDKIK